MENTNKFVKKSEKTSSRAPNWTVDEILALINGYRLRIKTIDGKFSSTLTSKQKRDAYQDLTNEVNSVSANGGRTWEQVKKKLEDQKSRTREKAAKIKKHQTATGGGPPCAIVLEAHEEVLLGLINPQMVSGIIEEGDSAIPMFQDSESIQCEASQSHDEIIINISETIDEKVGEISNVKCALDGEIEEIFSTPSNGLKTFGSKRRRTLLMNETPPNRVTSSQANEMLEIEKEKLGLCRKLVEMKKLKLQILFKQMKSIDLDITSEEEKLDSLFN